MTILLVLAVVLFQATAVAPALENEYVRVSRDAAPCASATVPGCGDRVIVALGDMELRWGKSHRKMARGDIAVFKAGESYEPPVGGAFFEVVFKANRPPVQSPGDLTPPEKNALRYDGDRFFIFEERLAVGDTRAKHGHSQRVVMQLNRTRLQQWPEGKPMVFVETVPDSVNFNPPVVHTVKNVGDAPLRGIVIEFKPERQSQSGK